MFSDDMGASSGSGNNLLITLAIRHYNNAPFVEAALAGAFAQTYSPLEILFLDDCSSDNGIAIAQRLAADYRGPHQIVISRNRAKLGPGGQMMRVRELARGEIIVFADADDISLPERCSRVHAAFAAAETFGVLNYCDFINAEGRRIRDASPSPAEVAPTQELIAEQLALGRYSTTGACLALRRRVLEAGVPIDNLTHGEDLVCGFRCALLGQIGIVPDILVHRRIHDRNFSGPDQQSWTARELRSWNARWIREAVLVPAAMRRDLERYVRDGSLAPARAEPLASALAIHSRRLKLLRAIQHLPRARAWLSLCEFRRLGIPIREGARSLLPFLAPRLEILRKRYRGRIGRNGVRGQGAQRIMERY
jgi:glycosyltransferase involved in cell wall biosynthesis